MVRKEKELEAASGLEPEIHSFAGCTTAQDKASDNSELEPTADSASPLASPFLPETSPGVLSIEGTGVPPETPPGTVVNPLLETIATLLRGLAPEDRAALAQLLKETE